MSVSNPPPMATERNRHEPMEMVTAIERVVLDIDEFVGDWLRRLNDQLQTEPPAVATDDRLEASVDAFEHEKNRWRLERDLVDDQIREKVEQLTQAWLHLETEQRKFLQMKELRTDVPSELSVQVAPLPLPTTGSELTSLPSQEAKHPSAKTTASCFVNDSKKSRSSENAVLQFQRLRKEVQDSRRR